MKRSFWERHSPTMKVWLRSLATPASVAALSLIQAKPALVM